ncbi:MAG: glycosyltransferase [Candidatus Thermoplasmatota archaeon]
MDFSVVIAVKNEKKYIKDCVKSVFNQNYKGDYEVIVVDGMSDDGTYEVLKEMQNDFDLKVYRNKRENAAAGRNIGINKAEGEFVAFIDGDAIASKNWLTQIKKTFEKYEDKNLVGVGGTDRLPEDSSKKARMIGWVMTSPLARGGRFNPSTQHTLEGEEHYAEHIPTCNLCLKKKVFDQVGLFDENFVKGQDLELNYRITNAGFKLIYSPKVEVVHYRKNHIRVFARQIFKWAKAKVAITKKHGFQGLTSHVYFWPVYLLVSFILVFSVFLYFELTKIFLMFFFLCCLLYVSGIFLEGVRLAKKNNKPGLILYGFTLLPLVHISYSLGVFSALLRKKIW